VDDGNNKFS